MTEGTAIHWFRQDLRIKDNPSLESAAKYKSFIPIYILDDETDQKYGAGILYNINNRSAFTVELSSSKIFDSTFKLGYQINF